MIGQYVTAIKFSKKTLYVNETKKASGIEPPEVEKGVADTIQLFKDSDVKHSEEKDKRKETLENKKIQAEEFRRQSLETIGETKKRKNEDDCGSKGKRRRSDETIEYLREKNEQEKVIKQQELELKKAELDDRRAESKTFREMLLQQQQQTAALMQQQQQVNMALLQFMTKQNNNQ